MPFTSIDDVQRALAEHKYVAERGLATALYLSLKLPKPLFLEGEAGVGKTEVAKVLAAILGSDLIRLQCYEGLDVSTAVYEWNYARQMMRIRIAEFGMRNAGSQDLSALHTQHSAFSEADLFGSDFLVKRPLALAASCRGYHEQPDARDTRRAEAALPVPLDTLPRLRKGSGGVASPSARGSARAGGTGGEPRAAASAHGLV
jgi:hypothetical protein